MPAPQVGVLTTTATTSIADGFGRAATGVQGLTITLPAITLPAALALPTASSLPAFGLPTTGTAAAPTAGTAARSAALRARDVTDPITGALPAPVAGVDALVSSPVSMTIGSLTDAARFAPAAAAGPSGVPGGGSTASNPSGSSSTDATASGTTTSAGSLPRTGAAQLLSVMGLLLLLTAAYGWRRAYRPVSRS